LDKSNGNAFQLYHIAKPLDKSNGNALLTLSFYLNHLINPTAIILQKKSHLKHIKWKNFMPDLPLAGTKKATSA
jgi:hypothetical protein